MTWFLLILGLLPSFAWLEFYLREDLHPEPKRLLVTTFVSGALFAFLAIGVQLAIACSYLVVLNKSCTELGTNSSFTTSIPFLIAFALVEEVAKFLAAFFVVRKSAYFDEPVDAMVYLIVASLSFAAVENIGQLMSLNQSPFIGDPIRLTALRFVGATLLHTLTSAIAGFYWAISIRDFGATRFIYFGLLLATALHTFFNYLILRQGKLLYTLVFLCFIGFFVLNDFEKLRKKAL